MTNGKSLMREPSLGQVICVPANAVLADDSMSSLGSSQSSTMDSTEEQSIEIEFDFDVEQVDRMRRSRRHSSPMKQKRTKPRRQRTMEYEVKAPDCPPHRRLSSPDLSPPPKSRWDLGVSLSCESSPAHPQRSSRRLMGNRPRPTIAVDSANKSISDAIPPSPHSQKLTKVLDCPPDLRNSHSFHDSAGDVSLSRWCADESLSLAHNSISGSHTRWQDSFASVGATGSYHESMSRWSTHTGNAPSLSSSQMELISTRPRVPRRKRSNSDLLQTSSSKNDSFTMVTEAETTDTQATGRATIGSSQVLEEFSMESSSTNMHGNKAGVVVDCSLLTATTNTSPMPTAKVTKPRPQLPNRQKSFGRGLSMGMAAQAAMATKRASLVRQRSEPSLPKRQPSELTLSSLDSSSSRLSRSLTTGSTQGRTRKEDGADAEAAVAIKKGNENMAPARVQRASHHRRSSIGHIPCRRNLSLPSPHHENLSSTPDTACTGQQLGEAPRNTGRFAVMQKQKSLSCLQARQQLTPKLPQRQASDASSLADILAGKEGSATRLRRERSISSLCSSHSTGAPRAARAG